MPTQGGLIFGDLGGGINEGLAPTDIKDNEFESMSNFLPYGRKLIRRLGIRKLSTTGSHTQAITGILPIKLSTGTWRVVVLSTSAAGYLNGTAFTLLTNDDGVGIGAGTLPWVGLQYKDIGYAIRRNCTGMRRISGGGTNFDVAGIPAPLTNAVIADAGVGAIEAGNVYGYYTFYNTNTGAESNPSPVSALLAHAANQVIQWTSVDVSTDIQVNARRLYRTTPGAAPNAPALFVGQINNNTATTFTENVTIAAMGDPMMTVENGLPPVLGEIMELHLERLFISDGTDIFFSEFGLPESFDPTNVISIRPDDGHEMRALHSFSDKLIAGKTNQVYGITGTGAEDFDVGVITEDYGCYSHHSMKSAGGSLFWFAGNTFCRSSGAGAVSIADIKLKNRLSRISDTKKQYVVATVDPTRDLYIVSIPLDGSGNNNEFLAYNYKNDAWAPQAVSGQDAFAAMADVWGSNFERLIYVSGYPDNNLYQLFRGDADEIGSGGAIVATWKGKRMGGGQNGPATLRSVRRAFLLVDGVTNDPDITLQVYRDGETAPSKERTVPLSQPTPGLSRRWLGYNLSTLGKQGATIALGGSYSGTDEIQIEAIALETLNRNQRVRIR